MDPDIPNLIDLTEEMSHAFAQDDLDRCAHLLEARGHLLNTLLGRYGPGGPLPVPDGLRQTMDVVRAQDRALEARLLGALSDTGRHLGDLQQKTRRGGDGSSGVHLNRRV